MIILSFSRDTIIKIEIRLRRKFGIPNESYYCYPKKQHDKCKEWTIPNCDCMCHSSTNAENEITTLRSIGVA